MSKHAPAITQMDQKYLREVFKFHANDADELTYEKLHEIFNLVEFHPTEAEIAEYKSLFVHKKTITFNNFLGIFTLKYNNDHNQLDIINAFKMIADEDGKDGLIKME